MELPLPAIVAVSFLLPLVLFFCYSNPKPDKAFKPYPIVGHLPQFVKNRHRILEWQTEMLAASPTNTVYLSLIGDNQGVLMANPANIEHALKNNFECYPKGHQSISRLEDFLGRGIFNSDGQTWRKQRKAASFEFNTKSLRSFVVQNVHQEITTRLMPLLRKAAGGCDTVDLQDVMERFTFDNVCQVAFNEDPACLSMNSADEGWLQHGFAAAFRDAAAISGNRFRYVIPEMWRLKRWLNVGSERRLRESISAVDDFALRVIQSRKEEMKSAAAAAVLQHQDLLSRFASGDDKSERFLRDVVVSFILAGRDTTSSALTWFFWLLSQRPDVETKVLEEIRSVRDRITHEDEEKKKKNTFGFADLRLMNYLHAAISEAMRLYPPVPFNASFCRSDDVLPDGTQVRKGWFLAYNSYALGRMTAVWGKDCCEFWPERWLDADGTFQPANPFKYPIFSAGPRSCLGKEMAYIQMKSIAATVIENFTFHEVGGGARPDILLSLTLRMKGGLPVIFKERTPT